MKKERAELDQRIRILNILDKYNKEENFTMSFFFNKSEQATLNELRSINNDKSDESIIKLNISGEVFTTTKKTINRRENMLKVMINSEFQIDKDENGCMVIADRNPHYFPIILEHIRTGSTKYIGVSEEFPTEESLMDLRNLLEESDFFGTQKLSNIIALKIKKDRKILSSNSKEENEPEQHTGKDAESNKLLISDICYLTKEEKEQFDKYLNDKETELSKLRDQLKELDEKVEKPTQKFNVRGHIIEIGVEKLIQNDSTLTTLWREYKNNDEIFIDRNTETFRILVDCFNSKDFTTHIPKEIAKRKQLYNLAKELNVKLLLNHLDPLRYPFELIGETNLTIKKNEDFLRDMFNSLIERNNPLLQDPKLHLIELFKDESADLYKKTELPSSVYPLFDFENEKEAAELCKREQIKQPPVPVICDSKETFQNQFDAFSCYLLKDLDWSNIVCAGGSVLNCLLRAEMKKKDEAKSETEDDDTFNDPNDKSYWTEDDESNDEEETVEDSDYFTSSGDEEFAKIIKPRSIKKEEISPEKDLYFYYKNNFEKSDIDIFLYDIDEKRAIEKIIYIYEHLKKQLISIPDTSYLKKAYRKNDLTDIAIVRTDNALTFTFHPNFRKIQIILRLYKGISEIVMGFDVASCCIAYDGQNVFALPRAVQAFSTRCNIVDPDRQSTTFETRLVKYALRGFRVGVPGFSEKKICNKQLTDPEVLKQNYDWYGNRSNKKLGINQVTGLARLLLIRNGIKNCTRKNSMWWSVNGGFTLEQTERKLSRPLAPYVDLTTGFSSNSHPRDICNRIHSKLQGIKYYGSNSAPFVKASLNDIKRIVDPDSNSKKKKKSQSEKLKFITSNPGGQNVGSFFPHSRNFFQDAYTSQSRLRKSKNTYTWREDNQSGTTFSKEQSKLFEKKYRTFLKTRDAKDMKFPIPDDKEGKVIDFKTFYTIIETTDNNTKKKSTKYVSRVVRYKNNNRICPRIKHIAQVDHQAVLFGEDEADKEEQDQVDEESFVTLVNHHRARPETTYQQRSLYPPTKFGQQSFVHNDDDDDDDDDDERDYYDDDDDDDFDDYDEDDFNPGEEEFHKMLMMNALLNQNRSSGQPPNCPQQ